MTNPIIRIHNVETGEVIDREMTNEEVEAELNPVILPKPSEAKTI
jgi:hypothetical protein